MTMMKWEMRKMERQMRNMGREVMEKAIYDRDRNRW
jgi:hypothetical protein